MMIIIIGDKDRRYGRYMGKKIIDSAIHGKEASTCESLSASKIIIKRLCLIHLNDVFNVVWYVDLHREYAV